MTSGKRRVYEFGPFRLDPEERILLRDGQPVPLGPKAFEALVLLVENSGHLIDKDEFKTRLWAETFVEDGNLTFNISVLRKALGDDRQNGNRYIDNVPKRGYRFIAPVVAVEISSLLQEVQPPTSQDPDGFAGRGSEPSLKRSRRKIPKALWAVIAVAVVLIASVVVLRLTPPLPAPRVLAYRQLTDGRAKPCGGIVSDGLRVYFTESTPEGCAVAWVSIYGGAVTRMQTPLRDVVIMDISPDRSELLIGTPAPGTPARALWMLPSSGGSPRRLGDLVAHSASCSPDGQFIAYANDQGLYMANADGSEPHRVVTVTGFILDPRWRPDGRGLCFDLTDSHGSSSLWGVEISGKNLRPILSTWSDPHREGFGLWTGDARHFAFISWRGGRADIWSVNEQAGLLLRGRSKPVRLTTGPMSFTSLALSPDNSQKLFAVGSQERGGAELVRYDPRVGEFIPYLGGVPAHWVVFSRDGASVAYLKFRENTLWRMRPNGRDAKQLTFSPMNVAGLDWSADGKHIAVRARKPGRPYKIYLVPPEGGDPQELLPEHRQEEGIPTWSPDGGRIAFGDVPEAFGHPAGNEAIHIYDLRSRRLSNLPGSEGLWSSRWSPDGRYIAATTIVKQELMVFDFRFGKWRDLGVDGVRNNVTWSRHGDYIYFDADGTSAGSAIFRVRASDGKLERVVPLNLPRAAAWWSGLAPDSSPMVVRAVDTDEIYALDMDWR